MHLRTHTGATPYVCSVRGCKKCYVSKQLLLKHQIRRHPELRSNAATELESRRNKKYLEKMGASSIDHVQLCQDILGELLEEVIKEPTPAKGKKIYIINYYFSMLLLNCILFIFYYYYF